MKEKIYSILERSVKTFCQTAVSVIGTDAIGITDVDWMQVLSVSGLAAVLSVLTTVATQAAPSGAPGSNSAPGGNAAPEEGDLPVEGNPEESWDFIDEEYNL